MGWLYVNLQHLAGDFCAVALTIAYIGPITLVFTVNGRCFCGSAVAGLAMVLWNRRQVTPPPRR